MRKMVWIAGAFFAACALCVYLQLCKGAIVIGLGMGLCWLVLRIFGGRRLERIRLVLFGAALGLLWCVCYGMLFLQPAQNLNGKTAELSMRVCSAPQQTKNGASLSCKVPVEERTYTMRLYLDESGMDLSIGDEIAGTVMVYLANDGSDGENLYFRSNGVFLVGFLQSDYTITEADSWSVCDLPARTGEKIKEKIKQIFPEDVSGFLCALLVGDRSGLTDAEQGNISVAGISHTIAISGMHVAILLGMIHLLSRRRRLTAAIGIPVIFFFVAMVGGTPSVVRAGIMQSILLLAPLLRRENDPPTSLGIAVLLILLLNPWTVASLSFQLSVGSMVGIFLFSGKIYKTLSARKGIQALLKKRRPVRALTQFVVSTCASTLGALVFTTPLIAWNFGSVSVYALATNLLVLWAISFLFSVGLVICLIGFVCLPVAKILGWLLAWLVRYVLGVSAVIAGLPFAAVYTSNVYVVFWLCFAYICFAMFLWKKGRKPVLFGCCLLLTLAVSIWLGYLERTSSFCISVLDVGQGQCIFTVSDGVTAMIDCGGSSGDEAAETAIRTLADFGYSTLHVLVLTHYDEDHVGGVVQLLCRTDVDTIYMPDYEDDNGAKTEIIAAAVQEGVHIVLVTQDQLLRYGATELTIFAPVMGGGDNESSLSVLYSVDDYDTLITGDMNAAGEQRLLRTHTLPDIEVLIAGHHGSKYSTCDMLLEQTKPEDVMISVGKNSYGHPAEETLERIQKYGAEIHRTDQMGTIMIRR